MSWIENLPLKFDQAGARELEDFMQLGYSSPQVLQGIATSSGLQVGYINWHQPANFLPMAIMQRAAAEGKMVPLLAELISDPSSAAIHKDIWGLLDVETAQMVHAKALIASPRYKRMSELADGVEYSLNKKRASLQKIVQKLSQFHNSAMFRFNLAKCEAKVVRIDIDEKGEGTGWLVGPDLILTAKHVLAKANEDWSRVTILCDHKFVPKFGGMLLAPGRRISLSENPLLASSGYESPQKELSENGIAQQNPLLLDFAVLRLNTDIGNQGLDPNGNGEDKRSWYKLPKSGYDFDKDDGLVVLGHPQLEEDREAGPLKFTLSLPCDAELTESSLRVRYGMNTEGGNSGSPVLNQDLEPVALHHAGYEGKPDWAPNSKWLGGFNQGIPLDLIVKEIQRQIGDESVLNSLGLRN